jgi:alkylation response protein AidB-like acyl-CoA dehydrogenase
MKFFKEKIKALVRQQSQDAERSGYLTREVLTEIYKQRLFKLFVPDTLNGRITDLPDAIKIFEEAAYIDGSFGWLITIGSGGGYFAPIFAPEVASKLFTPADAVVAGSGHPSGTAVSAEGGYRVSGSWRYCSGASYATIFTANCILADDSIRSFIFTPDQVQVTADWDAYGLKATASHTISVSDVFVPNHMTFDIINGRRYYEHPVYAYPFLQFAELSFAAVNIGICRHFFEEAINTVLPQSAADPARHTFVKELIERQQNILSEATADFYKAAQQSWDTLLRYKTINDDLIDEVNRSAKNVTTVSLLAAQRVYPYLGLSVAMEHGAINQCWRDLHTASQHILLKSFEL